VKSGLGGKEQKAINAIVYPLDACGKMLNYPFGGVSTTPANRQEDYRMDDWPRESGDDDPIRRDLDALSDFTLRALSERSGYRDGDALAAVDISLAQLPLISIGEEKVRAMPMDLPVPEGSQVLGSVSFTNKKDKGYLILLNSNLPADDIAYWYDARLRHLGWWIPDPGKYFRNEVGGFRGAEFTKRFYCRSEEGPCLDLVAAELAGRATEIRLRYDTQPSRWCKPDGGRSRKPRSDEAPVIPVLKLPARTTPSLTSITSGGDNWHSTAIMTTELDLFGLLENYLSQLMSAGWSLDEEGVAGTITWSNWNFKDENENAWRGTFLAIPYSKHDLIGKGQYFLGIYTYRK